MHIVYVHDAKIVKENGKLEDFEVDNEKND